MQVRTAVVTGAASGIGESIATHLANDGYRVIAIDRDAEALAESRDLQRANIHYYVLDLADVSAIENAWKEIVSCYASVEILVNNAAITHLKSLWEISLAEWEEAIAVNQRAVFILSRLAARTMLTSSWGRIVNVSSIAGQAPRISGAHYAATKGAVIALTRVFAAELAGSGVTVNAVAPGAVHTTMSEKLSPTQLEHVENKIPLGRLGRPSEIAAAVSYLVSEAAGFTTGLTLDINGGALMR